MNPTNEKTAFEKITASGTVVTTVILALGAFKMIIWGEHFNIPFFNYLNFSNLIQYAFGEVRTLIVDIALPVSIFLIWKQYWIDALRNCKIWLLYTIAIVLAIVAYLGFKFCDRTQMTEFILLTFVQIGIFSVGLALKRCSQIKQFDLVKIFLFALFLFSFVKINSNMEFNSIQKNRRNFYYLITFKDSAHKPDVIKGKRYVITNTFDFIFVQDDSLNSITAIPMSEIHSITTSKY
jgi:hypothetical protein